MADMTDNPDPCTDNMSAEGETSDTARLSPTQVDSPPANTSENIDYVPPYDSTQHEGTEEQNDDTEEHGSPQFQGSAEQQYDSPQFQGTGEQQYDTTHEGSEEQQHENTGGDMAGVTDEQFSMMSPVHSTGRVSSGQPSPRPETTDEPTGDADVEGGLRTPTGSTGSGGYAQQMASPVAQGEWMGERSPRIASENSLSPGSPEMEDKISSPGGMQGTPEVMSGGADNVEGADDADIDTGYTEAGYGDDSGGMANVNILGDTDMGDEFLRDPSSREMGIEMNMNMGKVLDDVSEDADDMTEEVTLTMLTAQVTETVATVPLILTDEQSEDASYDDEDVDNIEQEKAYASFTQVTVETTYEGMTGVSTESATETMMESIAGEMMEKERCEMIPEKEYESLSSGITEYTVRILPGGIVEKAADYRATDYEMDHELRYERMAMESEARRQNLCAHLLNLEDQNMKKDVQIRILTLRKGENLETTLFRLQKEWVIRFVLGPSLHADNVRMFTNHPIQRTEKFNRQVFREIKWQNASNMKSDRHDSYIDVQCVIAGSFNYFFTIDGSNSFQTANGKGYFLVDPTLPIGNDQEIDVDSIQCQTVLSKSLGPFEEWISRLEVAKEAGYNMIHFTPLQKLGVSNSSYSITDQKSLNPIFSKNKPVSFSDVEAFTRWMSKEWNIVTANDLVYNHTSKCSSWLQEHPESAYNLKNSPHLKPAFLMDRIFHHFSEQVSRGEWKHMGVSAVVDKEEHMGAIKHVLHTQVFPQYKLHEFYLCNIEETVKKFRRRLKGQSEPIKNQDIEIIPDENFNRNEGTINFDVAIGFFNIDRNEVSKSEEKLDEHCHMLREKLQHMNDQMGREIGSHIDCAIDNFLANVSYRFLAGDGPRLHKVTSDEPLMHDYFSMPDRLVSTVEEEEKLLLSTDEGKYAMACNGWVMNDNPLRNFAEPGNFIYFRRELIGWGDSIKLRYGKGPEDCPFLWQHMKEYTEITARCADAIRLDNCHSTPLHVAEYMIDAARAIRPNMYVFAELFTSSEATDNLFMNHLGINSLIRESLAAWNSHELGRLVHRYGGKPVGAFVQPHVQPLTPTVAHAMFFDQTHDNESPICKRSVYDTLASTALVAMSCCASGSNRGYDELVPHHIHVVNENRVYLPWSTKTSSPSECTMSSGIMRGKRILNDLHFTLGKSGFTEVYVDQLDSDVVSVTRHNPSSHETVVLIARTAFSFPHDPNSDGSYIKTVNLPGLIQKVLFEMKIVHKDTNEYRRHQEYINGLPNYEMHISEDIMPENSNMIYVTNLSDDGTEIKFKNFTPSSVIAFKISLPSCAKDAILKVRSHLNEFGYLMRSYSGRSLIDKNTSSSFREIMHEMNYSALNRAMFRVSTEDESDGMGYGSYAIPNFGHLTYCGLQGIVDILSNIRANNDLGHPVCGNLRDGDWMLEYIANRLKAHDETRNLGVWFEGVFRNLRKVPRYLIPCYFDAIVSGAFMIMREKSIDMMSDFVNEGSSFVQALALGSIQCCGFVKHAELPPLSEEMHEPHPKTLYIDDTGRKHLDVLSLAAGLPHFASGFARNWGRDTFIAIRGNLVLTGRFDDARYLILGYGGTLRHGLIPNLLLEGEGARYNCRDAFWWWIQCIQDYCKLAPNGYDILNDMVARIYPDDHCAAKMKNPVSMPLKQVMQEGMEKHARGVSYRERNAGPQIDNHMSDEGFNVSFGVDWKTGFVHGGNKHNCGTWMDMMGSAENAGTRGKPATPRDGSAVEIVALCKSAVTWLDKLNRENVYPYKGVEIKDDKIITYSHWSEKIQNNFEKLFWIERDPSTTHPDYKLMNRRGIYKDSYNASETWRDYQLRPNYPMAMVVAPELFTPEKAWHALKIASSVLQGPLGMKTLDPTDWNYCGFYDNNNDSDDPKVAKGFNYHNGPEWVWPIGFFFRAKLIFAKQMEKSEPGILQKTINEIKTALTRHYQHIVNSTWKSLPELTNENAAYCHPSCQAQAWSVSTILETLYDLEHII